MFMVYRVVRRNTGPAARFTDYSFTQINAQLPAHGDHGDRDAAHGRVRDAKKLIAARPTIEVACIATGTPPMPPSTPSDVAPTTRPMSSRAIWLMAIACTRCCSETCEIMKGPAVELSRALMAADAIPSPQKTTHVEQCTSR